ncbi:methylmalonyl-CoA epimerase [Thermaurantiacus sp.]
MKLGRLNHVGVATPSIDQAIARYRDTLGATRIHAPFDFPSQKVRVCFIDTPNAQIELLEPLGPESPLHGFLRRNPDGGQHHLCFEVEDILATRDELLGKGMRLVPTPEPRIGAHGMPVLFVHPKDMGGILVELMQSPAH